MVIATRGWRLVVGNLGRRLVEWSERGLLLGDALIDRVHDAWAPTTRPRMRAPVGRRYRRQVLRRLRRVA